MDGTWGNMLPLPCAGNKKTQFPVSHRPNPLKKPCNQSTPLRRDRVALLLAWTAWAIAEELGVSNHTVKRWLSNFLYPESPLLT